MTRDTRQHAQRHRRLAQNLGLGLASCLGFLLLLECGVRILDPQPAVKYRYSPTVFYEPKPNAHFNYRRREFSVPVSYNAFGMRDCARTLNKPTDVLRVALVGDSQTEAKEIPADSTWGSWLERDLKGRIQDRRIEVLNFGVSGYGTVRSWARFETLGRRFAPDVVVYLFIANDVGDVATGLDRMFYTFDGSAMRLCALPDNPRTRLTRALVDGIKQHFQAYAFLKFRFLELRGRLARGAPGSPAPASGAPRTGDDVVVREPRWVLFRAALAGLQHSVQESGAQFIVAEGSTYDESMSVALGTICKEFGVPLVRLEPALEALGKDLRFEFDGHWRAGGHRIASRELAPVVERELRAVTARCDSLVHTLK